MTCMTSFWLTGLRGKGTKLGEGEGSKLGDPCPNLSLSGPLRANFVCTNVASLKCHSTENI